MTVTAARAAAPQTGPGNDFPEEIAKLKCATSTLLRNVGISVGPNKLNRLCVTYVGQVAPKGVEFGVYLANALALDDAQRAGLEDDPLLTYNPLTHPDPVGHAVQRRVDTERGWRA